MASGNLTYQGNPCKRGHSGIRYINSGDCVECLKLTKERWRRKKGMRIQLVHGYARHYYRHPLYKIWEAMIARCENRNNISYPRYGAKGITVCDRWRHSFPAFLADVGERPGPGYSIDRIDGTANYEPSNVRWATPKEQGRNRLDVKLSIEKARAIRVLCARGFTYREIANGFGVAASTIRLIVRGQIWKE